MIKDADAIEEVLVRLTQKAEAEAKHPWTMDSVDQKFLAGMRRGIATFEVPITRLEGKWKLSQNRKAEDRKGVIETLRSRGEIDLAELMAEQQSN